MILILISVFVRLGHFVFVAVGWLSAFLCNLRHKIHKITTVLRFVPVVCERYADPKGLLLPVGMRR